MVNDATVLDSWISSWTMRVISGLLLVPLGVFGQSDPLDEGIRLFSEGAYAAAETHLRATLESRDDPQAEVFLALTLAATSRCQKAEPKLRKTLDEGSAGEIRRLAGLGLVRCRIAAERFSDAVVLLDRLRQDYPADADVLYESARVHLKAWNDVVVDMFEAAPASFRVNQLSAEIFEVQGKFKEAVGEYRKAIAKSPNTLNLHYRLGRALLMESHSPAALDAAHKEFEAELKLNPNDAVAEYQVAQILVAQQRGDEAIQRLQRSVELDPAFPEALTALGRLYSQAERHGEAVELLEQAAALQPESEGAHYALMVAYRNAGRREEAKRQQTRLKDLQSAAGGEFEEFLQRIGEADSP